MTMLFELGRLQVNQQLSNSNTKRGVSTMPQLTFLDLILGVSPIKSLNPPKSVIS